MGFPLVDLKRQFDTISGETLDAIRDVIDECAFVGGDHVRDFERSFAEYAGTEHCIGVGNGTDAIYIALECLGVGEGDEVIVPANTFVATSEAVTMAGADVVFADCEEDLYTIDPEDVRRKVSSRTRALVPVHLFGQPADMDPLLEIAEENDLFVIEDAAQAHGATYRGRPVGTLGDCACYSFYPGKNLGAFGDAGAVVTNDDELARRVRMFSDHGRSAKYDHAFEGVNSRLDGIQAAVLGVKLEHLERWTERRIEAAAGYDRLLEGAVATPKRRDDVRHVFHLYVIRLEERDRVREALAQRGISTGIHYPRALPYLEAYDHLGHAPEDFPVSHRYQDRVLSLPMHGQLTEEDVEYIAEAVIEEVG